MAVQDDNVAIIDVLLKFSFASQVNAQNKVSACDTSGGLIAADACAIPTNDINVCCGYLHVVMMVVTDFALLQDGCTALMCASMQIHPEVIEKLLRHHAQVDLQCNVHLIDRWPCATFWASDGLVDDVGMQNGCTALWYASGLGRVPMVELLLRHHAQVNFPNKVGVSLHS